MMKTIFLYGDGEKLANYTAALEAAGAAWRCSTDLAEAAGCTGLLLPGGMDIDPVRYGQENDGSEGIDPVRDQAELELIARFAQSGKPILGICRGIQVINVAFGGTLIQDLPNAVEHQHSETTGDQVHQVTAPAGSFLHELYGERFSVNSSHHQAIDRLAPGFAVAARCTDGTVEAIAWPEKAIYATQFHPERMTGAHLRRDTVDGGEIFRFFLQL